MGTIHPPIAAIDLMESHGPVDPLPQIGIGDRYHVAKELPSPVVLSPLRDPKPYALAKVAAWGDEGHPSWVVDRLEASNGAEKGQPFPLDSRFNVCCLELPLAVRGAKHKTPATRARSTRCLGEQDIFVLRHE